MSDFDILDKLKHPRLREFAAVEEAQAEIRHLRNLNAKLVRVLSHGQRLGCEAGLLGFAIGATRDEHGRHTQLSGALAGWADEIDAALARARIESEGGET